MKLNDELIVRADSSLAATQTPHNPNLEYIRILDGLRGISIILVMLFHFYLLNVGWIGVQIFFVLSGFLITTILLREKQTSRGLYFKRFYWRRVVRIAPLYLLYTGTLILLFYSTGFPRGLDRWIASMLTYTVNWQQIFNAKNNQLDRSIGHLWSLSVEEQYYIFWPMIVYFLSKKSVKVFLFVVALTIPLARILFHFKMIQIGYAAQDIQYFFNFSTLSQLEPFIIGAILAFYPSLYQKRSFFVYIPLLFFIVGGCYNIFYYKLSISTLGFPQIYSAGYSYLWSYTVINLAAASLVIICLQNRKWTNWINNAFFVFIGRISYGLYIYNYILSYIFLYVLFPGILENAPIYKLTILFYVYFLTNMALSYISFRYFERFFLKFKNRYR